MKTITDIFESIKDNNLDIAHFRSADVITNKNESDERYIVLHSLDGDYIDVIFYESAQQYVDHQGSILCSDKNYADSLSIAQLILKSGDNK